MNIAKLTAFFDARRSRGEPLVLATLIDTEGSTYSKTGDFLLIDANGVVCGMLSGGCLETDLAIRAQAVADTGVAQVVTYELGGDDEELWGLGTGCGGTMRIHLQSVSASGDYEPLASIAAAIDAGRAGSMMIDHESIEAPVTVVVAPPPTVLIVGLGADVEPLVRILDEVGFRCDLVDHRPALVDPNRFPQRCAVHHLSMDALGDSLDLHRFDAAVVMTHQLASDRACLRQLADADIAHIGLLGPAARRRRLLEEIGAELAAKLADRLEGPAGIRLAGRGAEAIALSIAAWLQQQYGDPRSRQPSAQPVRPTRRC
ncbi:MAG: XdhC family protein [Pseudomonadota bacterium]